MYHQINSHWLTGAEAIPSPNCNERPGQQSISLLVIHNISLPPGQFGGPHISELFTNQLQPEGHPYFAEVCGMQVSSHVLIRRDGSVIQYVPFDKRAWHAGDSCFDGTTNCNDFSIGIELEGVDDQLYEAIQYERLADVTRALISAYPELSQQRIVGHSDIAPGRKTDPGPAFDWDNYLKLLKDV